MHESPQMEVTYDEQWLDEGLTDAKEFVELLEDPGFREYAGISLVHIRKGTSKTIIQITFEKQSPLIRTRGDYTPIPITLNKGIPERISKVLKKPTNWVVENLGRFSHIKPEDIHPVIRGFSWFESIFCHNGMTNHGVIVREALSYRLKS